MRCASPGGKTNEDAMTVNNGRPKSVYHTPKQQQRPAGIFEIISIVTFSLLLHIINYFQQTLSAIHLSLHANQGIER
jgi:hypothetical protein